MPKSVVMISTRLKRTLVFPAGSLILDPMVIFIVLAFLRPSPLQSANAPHLIIRDFHTHDILLNLPIDYRKTFTIRYIHSVDKSPIYEVFRADPARGIVLVETYFKMFGAGMGYWKGRGKLVYDGEWTHIKDMDVTLGSFILRVGSKGVDHTVIFDGHEINLSEKYAGRAVEVSVNTDSRD